MGITKTQGLHKEEIFPLIPRMRVTGSNEREICTKMLRNFSENLRVKVLSCTLIFYSLIRISVSMMLSGEFLNKK